MDTKSGTKKTGAVLVLGGGIGGIQASLDLAESGYKVYLVEEAPAIGGVMAQLDKTLPTNDCSMCILSPKLVECGRHFNIELLTYSELLDVEGEAGSFTATVKKKARFVDVTRCTACNLCAEGCPVVMNNDFEEGLGQRKAIYNLYQQAVPNAYVIDKREERPCNAACKDACPIHMNVPGYIALIKQGMFIEAYDLIRKTNPLPGVCGRVCYAPCEDACNRGEMDAPLAIRELKRFVADQIDIESVATPQVSKNGKRVAIIGSGPAGLSAAHDLALEGYDVLIFEALPEPGGMLRYGIPEYRLPKHILGQEIAYIERLGVEIRSGVKVGDDIGLEELRSSYDAVFISVGAQESLKLGIPGENTPGVIHGIDFLRNINMGQGISLGKRVVVVGGGNVAIDVSRVARRLGVEVSIMYRRSRSEMPATSEEVESAEQEGVKIDFLVSPVRIIAENGRVSKIECIRMELGAPDESGRRRPVAIEGSEFTISVDSIIPALGQASNVEFGKKAGLDIDRNGVISVDKSTFATNIEGIFAGGDVVTGPAMVIDAIAAGKKAACSIDEYIRGEPLTSKEDEKAPEKLSEEQLSAAKQRFASQSRVKAKELEASLRIGGFLEVETGYSIAEAQAEAGRCLASQIEGCIGCGECEQRCGAKAINYDMRDEIVNLEVGSVILAPGLDEFDPSPLLKYGYGKYPNVVTSIQFERIMNASGPYQGEIIRPSDKKAPRKIAWIQCVGSRDESIGAGYCSSVCCAYAIKQAIIAKEHAGQQLDTAIFFMDMRLHGKGYENYYNRAKEEHEVKFIRSRVYGIQEIDGTGNLSLRFAEEDGKLNEEEFDLVVLSVGFRPSRKGVDLAQRLDIQLNKYGFCQTGEFTPVETSRPGIFVCGAFQGPKDIPETVMQASAAAANSSALLASGRNTLTVSKEYPPEKDVTGQPARVGAFICHCGINIGAHVDVPSVVEYVRTLPNVAYAEHNVYTCSQDTQERIKAAIKEHNLNRVVVAACTPITHEPLFRETIREAGLNPFLFEMASIREHCSWVHMDEPIKATQKAKDLVRAAIARAALLQPLHKVSLGLSHDALVVGGGIAGMTAALNLAEQGFKVCLVEQEKELGGWVRKVHIPLGETSPQDYLRSLIKRVEGNELVEVLTETKVVKFEGFVGNFKTTVASGERQRLIEHGVVIIATGAKEYRGEEYLLGQDDRVLTLSDLEEKIIKSAAEIAKVRNIAMVLCIRPEEGNFNYCSRVCCTGAIKNALKIKEINPEANIYILYKDIRTYGFKEELYTRARKEGIIFIRYDDEKPPRVSPNDGHLEVNALDPILGEQLILTADLLVLAEPMVPSETNEELRNIMKLTLTKEGFFHEAHVKLAPLDFSSEGIFMCGTAHSPKFIDESIAQAQAAAGRATTILSKNQLEVGGAVCQVDPAKCTACLTCVRTCPYAVPYINTKGVAEIEVAKCRGCGICAAECPRKAIKLFHCTEEQMEAKIEALLAGVG